MDDADGIIRKTGETYEIVFRRRLAKSIETVWAALTAPERIADWLAEATIEPDLRLGARFALNFPTMDYRMAGEIVALQPPRLIAWTWPDPKAPQRRPVVRFELEPDGAGCILTPDQRRLDQTGPRRCRRRLAHPPGAPARGRRRRPHALERRAREDACRAISTGAGKPLSRVSFPRPMAE